MIRNLLHRKFIRDTIALQIGKIGTTGMSVVSSLLVVRLMSVEIYGVWSLAQSFFTIWQTLNLTGIGISTSTRLAMAVGAKDEPEILNLSALYIQVMLMWSAALTGLLILFGPLLAGLAYDGDTRIGVLAVWLSLTTLPDALYNFIITALQSQRSMQTLAVLANLNQLVFLVCTAGSLLISPTPESLVVGRLVYSTSTMGIAFWFYGRERLRHAVPYPTLRTIFSHVRRVSPRRYWRFGFLNAIDKNISNLYTEIPLQLVGIFAGKAAAGYLEVGFKALTISGTFTSAVSDNLQAVIPQAVGRRDFVNLRRNLTRVLVTMGLAAVGFYTVFALAVPLIVLLFGRNWIPASPVIALLSIYGGVTMLGSVMGPLYRALNLLTPAIIVKVISLVVILLPGWLWLQQLAAVNSVWVVAGMPSLGIPALWQSGAISGAWIVNGLYIVSIVLTFVVTLPALNNSIKQQSQPGG